MSIFTLKDFVDDGMEDRGLLTVPLHSSRELQNDDVVIGVVMFGTRHGIANVLRILSDEQRVQIIKGKCSFYRYLPFNTSQTTYLDQDDLQSFAQRNKLAPSFGMELKAGRYSSFDRVVRLKDPMAFEWHFLEAALEDADHPWVLRAQWGKFRSVIAPDASSMRLEVSVTSDVKSRIQADNIYFTLQTLLATYAGGAIPKFDDLGDETVFTVPIAQRGLEGKVYEGVYKKMQTLQDALNLGCMSLKMTDSTVTRESNIVVRRDDFVGKSIASGPCDAE